VRLSGRPATVAVALALAACTSGAPRAVPGPRSAPPGPLAASTGAPGCSVAAGTARQLPAGRVRLSPVPGDPFGVAVTADGRWSFVSYLPAGQGGGEVGVFADSGSASPRLIHQIPVHQGLGLALTPGDRYLLVAEGTGIVVVSVPAAEQGAGNAVLGTLSSGGSGQSAVGGAIEVAVSPDGRFAFVSLETSGEIAVFDLQRALASHFRTSGFVGDVPMGIAPVGMAVSPNGDWLYATSELNPAQRNGPGSAAGGRRPGIAVGDQPGQGRDRSSAFGGVQGGRGLQPRAGGHLGEWRDRVGDRPRE
jgi:hypothetical protein